MKCQIKPNIHFLPLLWYHVLLCLHLARGSRGWVERAVPQHAGWLTEAPSIPGTSDTCLCKRNGNTWILDTKYF